MLFNGVGEAKPLFASPTGANNPNLVRDPSRVQGLAGVVVLFNPFFTVHYYSLAFSSLSSLLNAAIP